MRFTLLAFLLLFTTNASAYNNFLLKEDVFMTKLLAKVPSFGEYDLNTRTFPYAVVNGQVSREGYPIYAMTCDFLYMKDCYGEDGQYLGPMHYVASKMTPVSTFEASTFGWYCDFICLDADENIVGAYRPAIP